MIVKKRNYKTIDTAHYFSKTHLTVQNAKQLSHFALPNAEESNRL